MLELSAVVCDRLAAFLLSALFLIRTPVEKLPRIRTLQRKCMEQQGDLKNCSKLAYELRNQTKCLQDNLLLTPVGTYLQKFISVHCSVTKILISTFDLSPFLIGALLVIRTDVAIVSRIRTGPCKTHRIQFLYAIL